MSSNPTTAIEAAAQWQAREQEERQALAELEQQLAPLKSRQQKATFYGLNDPSLRQEAQTIGAEIQRIEGEQQRHRQALAEIQQTLAGMSAEILEERLAQAEQDFADAQRRVGEIQTAMNRNRREYAELNDQLGRESNRANDAFHAAAALRSSAEPA